MVGKNVFRKESPKLRNSLMDLEVTNVEVIVLLFWRRKKKTQKGCEDFESKGESFIYFFFPSVTSKNGITVQRSTMIFVVAL